jgi:hypothetical protein
MTAVALLSAATRGQAPFFMFFVGLAGGLRVIWRLGYRLAWGRGKTTPGDGTLRLSTETWTLLWNCVAGTAAPARCTGQAAPLY